MKPCCFSVQEKPVGFTLDFLLEYFLSGCLNCRHWRSAELAFGVLTWVFVAEQPPKWTAKRPEMFMRPGWQMGLSPTAVTIQWPSVLI